MGHPRQPEDSRVLRGPGTGQGWADGWDLPYTQAALPSYQPGPFSSGQAFWYLKQGQAKDCWDLCPLFPAARSLGSKASVSLCRVGVSYTSWVSGLGFPTSLWGGGRVGWGEGGGNPTLATFSQHTFDPDFVVLDDSLHVRATYISGELVWQADEAKQ